MSKRLLRHNFSLLHVNYVKLNEKWNYANVISPYFRIYYIDEGEGFVSSRQEKIKLEKAIYTLFQVLGCAIYGSCKIILYWSRLSNFSFLALVIPGIII